MRRALSIVAAMAFASVATMAACNYTQGATPNPNALSVTIWDEDRAFEMWDESLQNGESTCLAEREGEAARYWLYSCNAPRYIAAN
mgnify:CR=1 FL=1